MRIDPDETAPISASVNSDLYAGLSREELVAMLKRIDRSANRLGLHWSADRAGRDEAFNDDFVTIRAIAEDCLGGVPWHNMIIEGDNFDALRWLRMTMPQSFKCIYVDPPYNTGARDWVFNDDYHQPGDYFQTTWLEFLYRRFVIARDLITEDGVILVSINDENRAILELMLDQALPGMRIGSFTWRTKDTGNDAGRRLSQVHEHVLIYGGKSFAFNGKQVGTDKYRNPDNDTRGPWAPRPITKAHTYLKRENTYYPIQNPETGYWYPCDPDNVWRYATASRVKEGQKLRSDTIEEMIQQRLIYFPPCEPASVLYFATRDDMLEAIRAGKGPILPKKKTPLLREDLPDLDFWVGKPIASGRPSFKDHAGQRSPDEMIAPISSWIGGVNEDLGDNDDLDIAHLRSPRGGVGTDDLVAIMGSKVFDFPKPVALIKTLVSQSTGPHDFVLDFFAGSGTTAQAVLELNQEDGGQRRFVLVSHAEATTDAPDRNLAKEVTRERVSRVRKRMAIDLGGGVLYGRTHKIPIEQMIDGDALSPDDVWLAIQVIHGASINPYDASAAFQRTVVGTTAVAFCNEVTDAALIELAALGELYSLIVYSWTPGPIKRALEHYNASVLRLPNALHDRFVS